MIYPVPDHKAETVAERLVRWCTLLGLPSTIHSDQGREFESHLFSDLCKMLGIRKTRTTPYAPWSDGMVERANRTIKTMIQHYIDNCEGEWDLYVDFVAAAYRATVHAATGYSPNHLVFGRELAHPIDLQYCVEARPLLTAQSTGEYVSELRERLQGIWQLARKSLRRQVETQHKQFASRARAGAYYSIGDKVYVRDARGRPLKHGGLWSGPWRVTAVLNDWLIAIKTARDLDKVVSTRNVKPFVELDTSKLKP